jgi:predicted RNA methylase
MLYRKRLVALLRGTVDGYLDLAAYSGLIGFAGEDLGTAKRLGISADPKLIASAADNKLPFVVDVVAHFNLQPLRPEARRSACLLPMDAIVRPMGASCKHFLMGQTL